MTTSNLALVLGVLACASGLVQSRAMYCRLNDNVGGGYVVDLSPLTLADSSWKAISTDGHDYYMNVCDGLKGMESMSEGCMPDSDPYVSVCQDKKDADGNTVDRFPKIAGSADENEASLDWLDDDDKGKGVVLQYKHGEGNNGTACHSMYSRVTTIRFSCKQGSGMGNPVFIKEGEECEFLFSWETEFACLRTSTDPIDDVVSCSAINSDGDVIDLQPLAKEESDWQVGNGDTMYHLNLCHGLKGTFAGDCNVKSSGCQTGAEGLEKSLGWAGVPQRQNDDIAVSFSNGTRCHVGKDAEGPRTAKIVFHCDAAAGLGEPIFSGEDAGEGGKGCLYLFEWTTAVACKPLQPVSGNCSVYDNIDEHTYDLSPLRLSEAEGYTISYSLPGSQEEHVYNVNICGVDKRCGDDRSGACIVGEQTDSVGVASSKLEYNHGFLWLSYNTSIVCGDGFQSVDILFLCNHEASINKTTSQTVDSKFLRVQNEAGVQGCKHLLEYETVLACPPMEEISCEVQDPDTGVVYDLTNLDSNTGGWEVFSEEVSTAKYILNLCSPVKSNNLCADDQGACQVMYEGDDLVTPSSSHNIGRLSKPRLITSPTDATEKVIVLDYVGGEVCHKQSTTRLLRSTSINIYCKPGAGVGEPVFVDETDCHYHFEWYSASACAVTKGTNGTECMVTDPRTGHAFDFRSLTSETDYSVSNGEYEYLFNVCGPSKCDPDYGGCQKKVGEDRVTGIGKWSNQLTVTDDVVRLAYADGVGPCHTVSVRHMQINFACPTSESNDGDISFVEEDANCGYFVEFTTSLACAAPPIQCIVNGPDGVVYDFTRLMINNDDANYQTSNPLTGDIFEINICRSLVKTELPCPLQAAACLSQVGADASAPLQAFNLGLPAKPSWDSVTGHPIITYVGGDFNDFNSTNIVFVCPAQGDSTSGLAFNSIICDDRDSSKSCTHSFTYYTQLVCVTPTDGGPTEKPGFHPDDTIKGVGCKVTDPVSGDTLDFSDMGSDSWPHSEHALADAGGHAYALSVCSNSPVTCGDKTDAMACQSKDDKAWSLGGVDKESMGLELVNGVARITYSGGEKCHVNKSTESTRGALIEFRCHPAAGLGYPVFRNETDDCKYDFIWETARACLSPYKPSDCKANDGQNFYDLSSLAKRDSNWQVSDPLTDALYEMNVCRALVPSLTSKCNHTAGACQKNSDGSQKSLGFVTEPKFNDEGKLVLEYKGGDLCHGGLFARALLVEFECPRDGAGYALSGVTDSPVFVAETDDCTYKFSWRTSAACAVDETFVPVKPTSCEIVSPTTGQAVDLTPLSGTSFKTESADKNFKYEMQFCGSVVGLSGECSQVGACQTDKDGVSKSLGKTTGLSWSSSGVREDFSGGSRCHEGNYKRTATVDFRCDPTITSASASRLEFISEHDDCTYEFVLHTKVACSDQPIDCTYDDIDTGVKYDLSPLRKSDTNWVATGEHEEYWYEINVCRGLIPNPAWTEKTSDRCTGASACQVSQTAAKSVGGTTFSSLKKENGNLVLRYFNGTVCSNDAQRETLIEFVCGKDVGRPMFVGEVSKCQYKFAWATSYACAPDEVPAAPVTPAPTMPGALPECLVINPFTGRTFDLSGIAPVEGVSMGHSSFFNGNGGASDSDMTFSISPCGNQRCGGAPREAAVCVGNKVAGDFQTGPKFEGGSVVVEYASNGVHGHGMDGCDSPPGSRIVYKCDWSPPEDPVKYLGISDCTFQFEWYTKFVCTGEAELECVIDHAGDLYDLTPLAKSWGNWVVDTAASGSQDSISLNMCKQLNQPATDCYDAAVCLTSSSKVQAIGYMHAEPTYTPSWSGKDGVITIWYPLIANDEECGTSVTLVCSPGSLGSPVLTSNNGCFYGITWETSVACTAAEVTTAPDVDDNGFGSDCQVQTTASGLYFDLRSLRDLDVSNVDVPMSDGSYDTIKLAVCASVNSPQYCNADAGACALNGKSWGAYSHKLSYISNSLVLEYLNGDSCPQSGDSYGKHTTMILFECEDESNPGSPVYDASLSSACKHVFIWKTEHACPHVDDFSCVVKDKMNNVYDLSPLKRLQKEQGNWIVTGKPHDGDDVYEYELNLCHGLLEDSITQVKAGTACAHGTAMCQFTIDTDSVKSLGVVHQPEIDADGKLVMFLKNGDICGTTKRHREASVEFICDPNAGAGNPTFIDEVDHCVYLVEWKTAYACAVEKPVPHDAENCHIEDVGGSAVSLVPLGDKPMRVTPSPSSPWPEFEISVCGARSTCPHGHVCVKKAEGTDLTERWHSLGTASTLIASGHNTYTMETKNGDLCPDGENSRSSSISFVCRKDMVDSKPQMTRNYLDCSYSFLWETALACGQPSSCTVFNPISKKPLYLGVLGNDIPMFTSQNGDSAEYHLSLCESQKNNPCMEGTRLRRTELTGSGVCVVIGDKKFSLGEMQNSVPIMSEKGIEITYKGGDTCASLGSSVGGNGNGPATSVITFTCSKTAGDGQPRLSEKPDPSRGCVFKFQWDTCRVCDGPNPCNIPPTSRPTTKPASPNASPTFKPAAGDRDGNSDKESKPKSSGVTVAFIVLILAGVVAGVVYFLKDAERRDKVRSMIGLTGSSGSAGAFRYKSVNNNYSDSDNLTNGLLFNSDGEDDDEDEDEDIFKSNKVEEDNFPSDLTDGNDGNDSSDKAEDDEDLLDSI
eukprot:m.172769 g.172769  ORF g.172769 m.172769 type:complete len:2666 (-) comp31700_c1_seq1:1066-9063(-)